MRNLSNGQNLVVCIFRMLRNRQPSHDDPSVTELSKVRQSACIIVGGDVKGEGEIGNLVHSRWEICCRTL